MDMADRLAAAIVGLILGLLLAVALIVTIASINQWWLFIAVPLACASVAALTGQKFTDGLFDLLRGM